MRSFCSAVSACIFLGFFVLSLCSSVHADDAAPFKEVFNRSLTIRMNLENNPLKAERIIRKFEDYFGLEN